MAFGMNAITAFVLHGVIIDAFMVPVNAAGEVLKTVSYQGLVQLGLTAKFASLLWALSYLVLCFIPIWIMYRRNVIVKI